MQRNASSLRPLFRSALALAAALASCAPLDNLSGGDACDADTLTSIDNCGQCGNACALRVNSVPACKAAACAIQCNSGYGNCDGNDVNGCETSTTSDGKNCGACSHDCQGAACNAGACEPIILAMSQDHPMGLALDATRVYWANHGGQPNGGAIVSVPKAGGAPQTLFAGEVGPAFLVTDGASLYWADTRAGTVAKGDFAGSNRKSLVVASGLINDVAVRGGKIFWCVQTPGAIGSASSVDGSNPVDIAPTENSPQALTTSASFVYWVNSDGPVRKAPLSGGSPTTVVTGPSLPQSVALDATSVYWVTFAAAGGSVFKTPLGGGVLPTSLAAGQANPVDLTLDAASVYWINQDSGTIMRASLAGENPIVMASKQSAPQLIVGDATTLYWTNGGDGTVMKLAK